jgi:hypothetical protein
MDVGRPGTVTSSTPASFGWTTFDRASRLPVNWQREIAAAAVGADIREFPRTPILSREAADVSHIRRGRVDADQVQKALPWLYELYQNDFLELARLAWPGEPVEPARDDRYGIVLNVQRGTAMRFECHVDSNPLTGLLFCTDHRDGGELVFATIKTPRASTRSSGTAQRSRREQAT